MLECRQNNRDQGQRRTLLRNGGVYHSDITVWWEEIDGLLRLSFSAHKDVEGRDKDIRLGSFSILETFQPEPELGTEWGVCSCEHVHRLSQSRGITT